MQRFKNILVVIDPNNESKAVIERAVDLARRNQAHITLVSIIDEPSHDDQRQRTVELPVEARGPILDIIEDWPPATDLPLAPKQSKRHQEPSRERIPEIADRRTTPSAVLIRERVERKESRRLEKWTDFVRQSGLQVDRKILYGIPFLEIIREVLRHGHDLVMATARGRSNLKERFFGSTTLHLMRKCPCPVWVVKASQPKWHTRILAAVDPNPHDKERQALNVKIMDLATSLARLEQRELVVVHAWTFPVERSLRGGHVGLSSDVDRWVSDAREQHRQWLIGLLKPYALEELESEVYLLKGEAGRLIPEVAAAKEVKLIVMGTVSRTGVAGLLIGNTAEKILHQVDCGVLAVKPDGFVTPVRLHESG
jgi:nucleotide-binding universal stress UspA family protein